MAVGFCLKNVKYECAPDRFKFSIFKLGCKQVKNVLYCSFVCFSKSKHQMATYFQKAQTSCHMIWNTFIVSQLPPASPELRSYLVRLPQNQTPFTGESSTLGGKRRNYSSQCGLRFFQLHAIYRYVYLNQKQQFLNS